MIRGWLSRLYRIRRLTEEILSISELVHVRAASIPVRLQILRTTTGYAYPANWHFVKEAKKVIAISAETMTGDRVGVIPDRTPFFVPIIK